MLRLRFRGMDLGRVRVASAASPLAETVFAVAATDGRAPAPLGEGWRQSVRRHASPADHQLASVLHPRPHIVLDLFTLAGLPETMGEAASELTSVDEAQFVTEFTAIRAPQPPRWLTGLGAADRGAIRSLAGALTQSHRRLVAPHWQVIGSLAEAHRQVLTRSLGERGVEDTLADVTGGSWDGATLSMPHAARWSATDVVGAMHGRGLVLLPTVLTRAPVPYFPVDGDRPAVLLCPVRPGAPPVAGGRPRPCGTERLLGRTRTALLRAVADGESGLATTEAAAATQVAASTASEHLTSLREAGLVLSVRRGRRVVHTATPLGRRLLDS